MMFIYPRETEKNHFSPKMIDHVDSTECEVTSLRRCAEYHRHISNHGASITALGGEAQSCTPREKNR